MSRYLSVLLIPAVLTIVAGLLLARVAWQLAKELHAREHTAHAVASRPDLTAVDCADPFPAHADDYNGVVMFDAKGEGYPLHRFEGRDHA